MSAIKEFLAELFEGLTTIEVAAAYDDEKEGSDSQVIAYSRMEAGGDAVHFLDRRLFSEESALPELQRELLLSAAASRRALRAMLFAALK